MEMAKCLRFGLAKFVVRLLEPHVVVTQTKTVGYVAIQDRHGLLCDGPFLGCVRLNDISLMHQKSDVKPLLVVPNPSSLVKKVASQIPVSPLLGQLQSGVAVELSVRQDRDGERLACIKVLPIRRHRILRRQKLAERS